MDDHNKEPAIRITAPADADKWPGPRYVFKDEPLKLSAAPEAPPKVLTSADFRNAEIESAIKTLERLERLFREGDPVREALANARRATAKHLVVSPSSTDGLRVIK
jgi:hypothetical protein